MVPTKTLEDWVEQIRHHAAVGVRSDELHGFLRILYRQKEAAAVLQRLEELSRHGYVNPSIVAYVHSSLGHGEATFEWLNRAVAEHDLYLIFLRSTPMYTRWKGDSRMQSILHRVGLPE